MGVRVGADCRIFGDPSVIFGYEPYLVEIGDHVTVTHGVRFITHDGGVWVFRQDNPDIDVFGRIRVGNNVFIGLNAVILPGVCIGNDCVIGAGAVVTRDVPSGTVAAGVPARRICSIAEYKQRMVVRAVHIRSLPKDQRRRWLEENLP